MPDDTFTTHESSGTMGGATGPEAKFDSGKSHMKKAANDLRDAATQKAQELRSTAEAKTQEYRQKAEDALEDAKMRARTFKDDSEQYIRENPTKAVLTAVGVGFVLGLIFRR